MEAQESDGRGGSLPQQPSRPSSVPTPRFAFVERRPSPLQGSTSSVASESSPAYPMVPPTSPTTATMRKNEVTSSFETVTWEGDIVLCPPSNDPDHPQISVLHSSAKNNKPSSGQSTPLSESNETTVGISFPPFPGQTPEQLLVSAAAVPLPLASSTTQNTKHLSTAGKLLDSRSAISQPVSVSGSQHSNYVSSFSSSQKQQSNQSNQGKSGSSHEISSFTSSQKQKHSSAISKKQTSRPTSPASQASYSQQKEGSVRSQPLQRDSFSSVANQPDVALFVSSASCPLRESERSSTGSPILQNLIQQNQSFESMPSHAGSFGIGQMEIQHNNPSESQSQVSVGKLSRGQPSASPQYSNISQHATTVQSRTSSPSGSIAKRLSAAHLKQLADGSSVAVQMSGKSLQSVGGNSSQPPGHLSASSLRRLADGSLVKVQSESHQTSSVGRRSSVPSVRSLPRRHMTTGQMQMEPQQASLGTYASAPMTQYVVDGQVHEIVTPQRSVILEDGTVLDIIEPSQSQFVASAASQYSGSGQMNASLENITIPFQSSSLRLFEPSKLDEGVQITEQYPSQPLTDINQPSSSQISPQVTPALQRSSSSSSSESPKLGRGKTVPQHPEQSSQFFSEGKLSQTESIVNVPFQQSINVLQSDASVIRQPIAVNVSHDGQILHQSTATPHYLVSDENQPVVPHVSSNSHELQQVVVVQGDAHNNQQHPLVLVPSQTQQVKIPNSTRSHQVVQSGSSHGEQPLIVQSHVIVTQPATQSVQNQGTVQLVAVNSVQSVQQGIHTQPSETVQVQSQNVGMPANSVHQLDEHQSAAIQQSARRSSPEVQHQSQPTRVQHQNLRIAIPQSDLSALSHKAVPNATAIPVSGDNNLSTTLNSLFEREGEAAVKNPTSPQQQRGEFPSRKSSPRSERRRRLPQLVPRISVPDMYVIRSDSNDGIQKGRIPPPTTPYTPKAVQKSIDNLKQFEEMLVNSPTVAAAVKNVIDSKPSVPDESADVPVDRLLNNYEDIMAPLPASFSPTGNPAPRITGRLNEVRKMEQEARLLVETGDQSLKSGSVSHAAVVYKTAFRLLVEGLELCASLWRISPRVENGLPYVRRCMAMCEEVQDRLEGIHEYVAGLEKEKRDNGDRWRVIGFGGGPPPQQAPLPPRQQPVSTPQYVPPANERGNHSFIPPRDFGHCISPARSPTQVHIQTPFRGPQGPQPSFPNFHNAFHGSGQVPYSSNNMHFDNRHSGNHIDPNYNPNNNRVLFCRACRNALTPNACFCSSCGERQ